MGDVLQIRDYQLKRGIKPVQTPLEGALQLIAEAMAQAPRSSDGISWPGMDSANYVAPEKDPA